MGGPSGAMASPRAEEDAATSRSGGAAVRRSRRESAVKAEAEPAAARRSQRSSAKGDGEAGEARRTRSRAVAVVVEAEAPVPASPMKLEVDASAKEDPPTPLRNRRPSRRQMEVDIGAAFTPGGSRVSESLLLDKYTANEATALCEVIWYHLKENSYKADVLLQTKSPACINWPRVAERLDRSHNIRLAPRDCQRLWQFVAYGVDAAVEEVADGGLYADSEPEEYEGHKTRSVPKEADARAEVTQPAAMADGAAGSEETTAVSEGNPEARAPATTKDENETAASTRKDTVREGGVQLYQEYDQPQGVPEEWAKAFDPKRAMPLVFVAEKFLKRKVRSASGEGDAPAHDVHAHALAAVGAHVTLSGEQMPAKPKRKRKSDVGVAEDGDGKKKPRKKKEAATAAAPKASSASTASTAAANRPASAGSTSGRPVYVPSSTPPPLPTPARSPFEFFVRMYRENPLMMNSQPTAAATSDAMPELLTTTEQLLELFASAPPHVRVACVQMAADDQRRFEREQLRRRLWEKATANMSSTPTTPAVETPMTPGPTSQTQAVPSQT